MGVDIRDLLKGAVPRHPAAIDLEAVKRQGRQRRRRRRLLQVGGGMSVVVPAVVAGALAFSGPQAVIIDEPVGQQSTIGPRTSSGWSATSSEPSASLPTSVAEEPTPAPEPAPSPEQIVPEPTSSPTPQASAHETVASGPSPTDPALPRGRRFDATSLTEDGQPRPVVAGTRITVTVFTFQGRDTVTWNGGCNGGSAHVDLAGGRFILTDHLGRSERGCPDGVAAQDRWVTEVLEGGATWRLVGEALELDADGRILTLYARQHDEGATLRERRFVATAATDGGAPSPMLPDRPIEIWFSLPEWRDPDEPDRVGWDGGCNARQSFVDIRADRLVLDVLGLGATAMGCSEEVHAQEDWLDTLMLSDPAWIVEEDVLRLTAGDRTLTLRPATP